MTSKRYTITVDEWTAATLEEIALLDHVSVSHVIRDCIRGVLPSLLEVTRFLHDPHTTDAGSLRLAADMERMLAKIAGIAGAGAAGASDPSQHRRGPRQVTRGPNTLHVTPE